MNRENRDRNEHHSMATFQSFKDYLFSVDLIHSELPHINFSRLGVSVPFLKISISYYSRSIFTVYYPARII